VTDLETRLRNAKVLKEKVLALLDRAGTLQAALEMEKEAARVTLDIERLEGALARIANQVTFGTLSVSLQPSSDYTPPAINPQLPFDWLREWDWKSSCSSRERTSIDARHWEKTMKTYLACLAILILSPVATR